MQIQQSQGAKTVGAGCTFARVQADAPTAQTASASADVGTVAPASGVVAAAQQHGVVTQDGFTIAKPREPSAQPVTKIKDAGPAKRINGCCLPPPPKPSFQESNKPAGLLERGQMEWQAMRATEKFNTTSAEALKDGKIDSRERRDIDAAGRDANIAEQKLRLDDARNAYQATVSRALADKRLTPEEANEINVNQKKVSELNKQLKAMQADDKILDRRDEILNNLDYGPKLDRPKPDYGPCGPGGLWPPRPAGELKFPSLPDFPKPPSFEDPVWLGPKGGLKLEASIKLEASDFATGLGIIDPTQRRP